jgi:hypothetical protein
MGAALQWARQGGWLAVFVLGALLAGCATKPRAPQLRDLDRTLVAPRSPSEASARVLVFSMTDCPIANSYAPELASLQADYSGRGVELTLVFADLELTREQARAHAAEYGLDLPIALDPEQLLARNLGVTTTPEAVLMLPDGTLAYRGRIDDAWAARGRRRSAVRRHDLRLALDQVLAGEAIAEPRMPAVGCLLPDKP